MRLIYLIILNFIREHMRSFLLFHCPEFLKQPGLGQNNSGAKSQKLRISHMGGTNPITCTISSEEPEVEIEHKHS